MAAPRLEEIARRLTVARHEALVEDDLDAELPSLRLQVRPWRGPWEEDLGPSWEILELVLEGGPEDRVVARRWIDGAETPPEVLGSVPASRLAAAWLEAQALTFIAGALGRQ